MRSFRAGHNIIVQTRHVLLFFVIQPGPKSKMPDAEDYLGRLQTEISHLRTSLGAIVQSSERAAGEFLAGGNFWVAGRQADFIAEACHRAGGLKAPAPLAQNVPRKHDVVLYATSRVLDDEDRRIIEHFQREGATVSSFCSPAGLFQNAFPVDTVINIVELWTWTAEFVAACTRLGKMPVCYQSYGLPGGYERAKKYEDKRFHDDLSIQPIEACVLGNKYLEQLLRMLKQVQETQMSKIQRAAEWWRKAKSATTLVTGHMFPDHTLDTRTVRVCDFVAVPAWEDKSLIGDNASEFVFYLGYQFAPHKLLEEANAKGIKLVYTDVQPADPPESSPNIVYIDPAWPLTDGCVTVPDYDIPIFPASGVIQAAIYWTIAAKAFPNGRPL